MEDFLKDPFMRNTIRIGGGTLLSGVKFDGGRKRTLYLAGSKLGAAGLAVLAQAIIGGAMGKLTVCTSFISHPR